MTAQAHFEHPYTVEEYFALEESTGIRHEYIDGEVYAMSGGTYSHSVIIGNLTGLIYAHLRKANCRICNSDMKVEVSPKHYLYPDLTLVCGEAQFADKKQTRLLNPTLVVEVLSDSSQERDFVLKASLYRQMPSVQAYLIVEQVRAHVNLLTRQGAIWTIQDYSGLEARVPIDLLTAELSLADIYEGIALKEDK